MDDDQHVTKDVSTPRDNKGCPLHLPPALTISMDDATQSLREDICRISGLLYRLQHWDVFSNPTISSRVSVNHPEPNLSLYNSLAIRLSTDSRRVAVTGRLTMESGLELVVASSDSATPIRKYLYL